MKNWKTEKFDNILKRFESGKRPKGGVSKYNSGIPSLGAEHLISNGGFSFEKIKYVPIDFAKSMNRGVVKHGDILVVKDGATTGKTSYVNQNFPFDFAVINEHVFICEINENHSGKYVFYYLWSQEGQDEIQKDFRGAAQGGISTQFPKKVNVPLPPLPTQHRIVEKIEELFSELDNGVENLKKAQKQLKTYRQAVLKDAFEGKLTKEWRTLRQAQGQDDLPTPDELLQQIKDERKALSQRELSEWKTEVEQWEKDGKPNKKPNKPKTHKIGTSLEVINSNSCNNFCMVSLEHVKSFSIYGPRYSSKDYKDKGIAVLRTSDISEGGKVDWKNAPKIPLSDYDFNKYKLKKGDLLITRTGSIGTISVFNDEVEAIPGAFLIHYRLIPEIVNTWYIFYFLKTNKAQNHFIDKSAGVGRPNLNVPSIEELLIPLPSIQEQEFVIQEIESRLSVVDQLEQTIKENLQKAEALRQSILKKAFRGELVENVN